MDQHSLRQPRGTRHAKQRIGPGVGSGPGTYPGRGVKGAPQRGPVRRGGEGGPRPPIRRLGRERADRS